MKKRSRSVSYSFVLLLLLTPSVQATEVVMPAGLENVEGDSNNASPWNCIVFDPSNRYQQVYLGSELGSGEIVEIQFRQDGTFGDPFGPTTIPDVLIQMSSTAATPFGLMGGLSPTFADNVGVDVTTVWDGDLQLASTATGGVPRPFDIIIPLATPFVFNTSSGLNLLLDVTIPECTATTTIDLQNVLEDSVARAGAGDHTSPTADNVDTAGLVTRFVFAAIFSDGFESGDLGGWSSAMP